MNIKQYVEMGLLDLRKVCKAKGIKGYSTKAKPEVIQLIVDLEEEERWHGYNYNKDWRKTLTPQATCPYCNHQTVVKYKRLEAQYTYPVAILNGEIEEMEEIANFDFIPAKYGDREWFECSFCHTTLSKEEVEAGKSEEYLIDED